MTVLTQLPVWAQALIAAAPWVILVLLIASMADCWPWWDDEDEDEP